MNMSEKLQLSDIDWRIEKFSPENDVLEQYFQLRFDVYNSFNMPYYAKPTSTRWDRHPDTRFLILVNKNTGKTVGGRRFIIHNPNSRSEIYSEENTGFTIDEMLPHLNVQTMRYAELGALCFGPEIRGTGASAQMYKKTFEYMREIETDFIVSNPITANYERLRMAGEANGMKQFVCRNDLLSVEDGDDEPTVFMASKTSEELNLSPPTTALKFRDGVATNERQLLHSIFGTGFVNCGNADELNLRFFGHKLDLDDLNLAHDFLQSHSANFSGREVHAAYRINTKTPTDEPAFMLLMQLHGNEPCGLAAFLYALALHQSGHLEKPVLAMIGNNFAAKQFFEHYKKHPDAGQEIRDIFRRGIGENGNALADMNRVPHDLDSLEIDEKKPYIARWKELRFVAENTTGILDIHSARGNMVCVTDSSNNSLLKNSNIRNILVGLTEAIGSATASDTFKTVAGKLPNIKHQFGIEAGTHEDISSYRIASEFACNLLHNLGISSAAPLKTNASKAFYEYQVQPKINFADLTASGEFREKDSLITAKDIDGELQPYQYEEMEKIVAGQVVAKAEKSGATLSAPSEFSAIFVTKSSAIFNDEAIGLYPVATDKMDIKFCYPCIVNEIEIEDV